MVLSQIFKFCRSSPSKNYKDIRFPVKIRKIQKIEKNPLTLVLLVMKIPKNIQSMYQKNVERKKMLIYC